jgi:hypothetical protein
VRAAKCGIVPGPDPARQSPQTLDQEEVDRFARLASEWWAPTGKFFQARLLIGNEWNLRLLGAAFGHQISVRYAATETQHPVPPV